MKMKTTIHRNILAPNHFPKVHHRSFLLVLITGLLCSIIVIACNDIFEVDLSGKKVTLVAPSDSLTTEYGTQTFYWEEMKGALSYNLQIVKPSFSRIEQFVIDTNVSVHNFTLNLTPGKYEWRVRAQNGSSKSDYAIRSLQIDSTLDLTKQKVLLATPGDGIALNINKIQFSWGLIYNATGYTFQVWKPDLNGTKVIDTTVNTLLVSMGSALADGNYTWGVKAFNNNTMTDLSTRKIVIDRTAPTIIPALTEPINKAHLTSWPVSLAWTRADSDGGSSLYDSVYVAVDTFFTAKVTAYKSVSKSQSITLPDDTTYFWKVITVDEAGNRGPNSVIQKFSMKTK